MTYYTPDQLKAKLVSELQAEHVVSAICNYNLPNIPNSDRNERERLQSAVKTKLCVCFDFLCVHFICYFDYVELTPAFLINWELRVYKKKYGIQIILVIKNI